MEEHEQLLQKIADLELQIKGLEKDIIHDGLTALKTRAFLQDELETYLSMIAHAPTSKRKEWFGFKNVSILFFDIDNFKQINDTYGHAIGDMVLRTVAHTIAFGVREGDTVARWGGEEMVAMLLGSNEIDGKIKAESLRASIESLSFPEHPDLKVTVSVGVAHSTGDVSATELVSRADKVMYYAKTTGKNKVVAFSEI